VKRHRTWAVSAAMLLSACSGSSDRSTSTTGSSGGARVQITGAGATFPNPIYSKWFADYNRRHPDIAINYQSQGSGAGIRQLINRTVFFGASDQPMTDEQLKSALGKVLHFPTVLGAVVPIYNLPEISQPLKFTGELLADITLGKVKRWNDPAIANLNSDIQLPSTDITVVHRSDGSGTTFIWVDYLSKVSPEFRQRVGVSSSVNWPVGVGGKGNEGVSGMVKQVPGSVGYVELIYAVPTKIPYGLVHNSSGNSVRASVESVTAAAESAAAQMPEDFRVSITNAAGAAAYPISSFTWILLYEEPQEKQKTRVMVDFLKWALTDGQSQAAGLGFAPLPKNIVEKELNALNRVVIQ
jgi:phosphate transport system substrate-binding protein